MYTHTHTCNIYNTGTPIADYSILYSCYKEACAGPTQTFVRPDTRAQEMWVKWEMNFDQPRFAVAPPTPSPVNYGGRWRVLSGKYRVLI